MNKLWHYIILLWVVKWGALYAQDLYHNGSKLTVEECLGISRQKEQQGDYREASRFLNAAALQEWEWKRYEVALDYFARSIELNRKVGNEQGIAQIQNNLAMIYADKKEYEQSLQYFSNALEYRRRTNDRDNIISSLINMAVVSNNLQRYAQSITYLEEALDRARTVYDLERMKICYGMLAETYEKAGNHRQSMYYFEYYKTFHEDIQKKRGEAARIEVAKTKAELALLEERRRNAELTIALREKTLLEKNQELTEKGVQLQDADSEIIRLQSSLSKREMAIRILEQDRRYDEVKLRLKELELAEERLKITARDTEYGYVLKLLMAGLLAAITIALLLYRQYREKKKLNTRLVDQNHEILAQQDQIILQKQQLETYSQTLEEQVKQRTQELQQANGELIQYNNQLEQFAYIVAHNLRAPIARLIGLTSVLDTKNPANAQNQVILEKLDESSHKLDSVIKDLNSILEIKKSINVEIEPIDLAEEFGKVCKDLQDEIDDCGAVIETNFRACEVIQSARLYLHSIMHNLLSNAIKYRSTERNLVVEVQSSLTDTGQIRLIFRDNGMGIDLARYGEKLFSLYKRFHDHVEGKGMGLYLVKTQIESLGGTITVESNVGVGTSFCIQLKSSVVTEV